MFSFNPKATSNCTTLLSSPDTFIILLVIIFVVLSILSTVLLSTYSNFTSLEAFMVISFCVLSMYLPFKFNLLTALNKPASNISLLTGLIFKSTCAVVPAFIWFNTILLSSILFIYWLLCCVSIVKLLFSKVISPLKYPSFFTLINKDKIFPSFNCASNSTFWWFVAILLAA